MNYYNEINPYCVAWLKNLISVGYIPAGTVDSRPIEDVLPSDLVDYTQCHFFAGLGGWAYALDLAGWPSDRPVWTGSCPCQPFSLAGIGDGEADDRHLWPSWRKLIEKNKPSVIFGEQVAESIKFGWLDGVICDLEEFNYSVGAAVLSASSTNAPHRRDRLWFVANAEWNQQPWKKQCGWEDGRVGRIEQPVPWNESWQSAISRLRVVDDGLSRVVEATDAARNAIVPQVAAEFIKAYLSI